MIDPLSPEDLRAAGFIASKTFDKEKQDLGNYVLMARCIFDAAIALADLVPEKADGYRSIAMNTSFNIAAACWPGWEDAHPDIPQAQRELALELCKVNVALGRDLDAPPARRFNGYWMYGVHQMAAGDHEGARTNFEAAANCAELMDSDENRLMAQGWMLANNILQMGGNAPGDELLGVIEELRALGDDGAFYAGQYAPALGRLSDSREAAARSGQ